MILGGAYLSLRSEHPNFRGAQGSLQLRESLLKLGLQTHFPDENVEISREEVKGRRVYRLDSRGVGFDLNGLVLGGMTAAHADEYISQRVFKILSLYSQGVSPYPGAVTDTLTCPPEMVPHPDKLPGGVWLRTGANRRGQIGVCIQDELVKDAGVLLLHCPALETVFDLTVIAADKPVVEALRKAVCTTVK